MKTASVLAILVLAGACRLAAQPDPVARAREVLPHELAAEVLALADSARQQGLPEAAVAARALEGWAKGHRGEALTRAVRSFVEELRAARAALVREGPPEPGPHAIEAAGAAMAMGVDAQAVSALAASAPSGRALAVPLWVTGALVERGLPADGALRAVTASLAAGAADAELLGLPDQASSLLAQGLEASQVLAALQSARAGLLRPPGFLVRPPMAPPAGVPANAGIGGHRPTPRGRPGAGPPGGRGP